MGYVHAELYCIMCWELYCLLSLATKLTCSLDSTVVVNHKMFGINDVLPTIFSNKVSMLLRQYRFPGFSINCSAYQSDPTRSMCLHLITSPMMPKCVIDMTSTIISKFSDADSDISVYWSYLDDGLHLRKKCIETIFQIFHFFISSRLPHSLLFLI